MIIPNMIVYFLRNLNSLARKLVKLRGLVTSSSLVLNIWMHLTPSIIKLHRLLFLTIEFQEGANTFGFQSGAVFDV